MIKKEKVLTVLDRSNFSYYCHFASLGHPYSYLIDARLSVFKLLQMSPGNNKSDRMSGTGRSGITTGPVLMKLGT